MPNLTPVSSFDEVPELETTTLALGGPGGPMNLPAQALLNRTQWLKDNAAASTAGPYAAGSGTANAITAAFTPPITSMADGLKLRILAAATNTGAATFAPDALTAQPIVGGAYASLQGGEILANGEVELTWNATLGAWVITAQAGGSPQVPDAAKSKQAASKGQVDQVSADLASTAAGKGSSLIGYLTGTIKSFLDSLSQSGASVGADLLGFLQAGTGAISRTAQDKLLEAPVSVEDFGAVGDGVTDDSAAITAAMAAAASSAINKTVYFSKPVYAIATGLLVPQGVKLVGRGNAFGAWNGYAASVGTILCYTGSVGGGSKAVRFFAHNYGGGGMERIQINSNNRADIGLELDGCVGLDFKNVSSFSSVAGADIKLTATTNAGVGNASITCSWNTFTNCYIGTTTTGKACLWLTGVGGANTCHNTFVNLHIDHGGSRHGVYLGNCDNNTFIDTMISRPSGTGNGVYCDPTEMVNFPVTNVFYHLQAGLGGWYQPNTTTSIPATVWDYQLDNGEPYPVLNGTTLNYSTSYGLVTSELPATPTLLSSWVSYGAPAGPPQYWKDRLGFVHLRGMAKNGTLGAVMFTLPAGYRPTSEEYFAVNSNGAFGYCFVKTDGSVMAQAGSNVFFSLSGITFRADYPQS